MNAKNLPAGHWLTCGMVITAGIQFLAVDASANPVGMSVGAGTASAQASGGHLTITTGNQTVLNWQSFNIAAGETTTFNQPSASSIVVNNIHDANASQIYGSLQANGLVMLMNPNGFYFGPNAFIKTGGLIVTTAYGTPPQNFGGSWEFNGPPPLASIVNYGQLKTTAGGSLFLIADKIENHGDIESPGGSIGLAAGQTVLLSERPDGRGLSMSVTLPTGSVNNYGEIVADAGTLALQAKVVNQNGLLQANSVREQNGQIELVASDTVNLGASSQIIAQGDHSTAGSAGGTVTLKSDNIFSDAAGSQIVTTGGSQGGNGGNIEVSAPNIQSLESAMDASAASGSVGGQFLLDPINISLTGTGATTTAPDSGGTVNGSAGTGTWTLNVNTAFKNKNFSTITLEASGNISLAANLTWDLSGANGNPAGTQLNLLAGGNITLGNGSKITDANNWSMFLAAGYNFTTHKINQGTGNLYLNGGSGNDFSGSLQSGAGAITLQAGKNIQLGSGSVTAGGGNILAQAGGDISFVDTVSLFSASGNGSITLQGGYNFASQSVANGSGNLYLNGGSGGNSAGTIRTETGAVTFQAGNGIQLGGGSVPSAGGNILAQAGGDITFLGLASLFSTSGSGSITLQAGYNFSSQSVANGSGNLYLNGGSGGDAAGSIQAGTGTVNLQAGNGIQLGGGSVTTSGGNILAQAGGDITFLDNAAHVSTVNGGGITLQAGYNYSASAVSYGKGNLYLDGAGNGLSGFIQTDSGAISLAAGLNITIGSGNVLSTAGGGISAHALKGNIDTGSDAQGYHFNANAKSLATAYDLSKGLGGISTEAGGNVTLIAGGTVTSVLPEKGAYLYDGNLVSPNNGNDYLTAGAGAYGRTQAGNVTVVAGGDITGHYLVANGTGSLFAGVLMDAAGNPVKNGAGNYVLTGTGSAGGTDLKNPELSLSLVHGGWNVAAAQNILLQEVNNPNGMFNNVGGSAYNHLFDYLGNEYVNLSAGNLVQLGVSSSSLARVYASGSTVKPADNVSIIYPSILNITAGSGGVILGFSGTASSLALFPSAQGSLTVDTTGSLVTGLPGLQGIPQQFNLIVSDSGSSKYTSSTSFSATDHNSSPVHLNSPTAIDLNIGGDMNLINLVVPEAAQVNVAGNMNNCGFQGMNISTAASYQTTVTEADGTTRKFTVNPAETAINVSGDIYDRGNFTSISLTPDQLAAINLTYLVHSENSALSPATLTSSFFLNGSTLSYQNISGQTLASVLKQLNNLTVQVYQNGVPQWQDPPVNSVPVTQQVSLFGDPTQKGTVAYNLLTQFNTLGAPPANAGINIGGGGKLAITARSVDLGTSPGIQSWGAALYSLKNAYPLAGLFGLGGIFSRGTDISVTTSGNPANGFTAAGSQVGDVQGDLDLFSSSIDSLFGGNIALNVSGTLNAGSSVFTVNSGLTRGIYSSSGGDVSVIAKEDINVNGSRIITYDGGNLTVESKQGNINAGSGSSTPVTVTGYYEDSVTDSSGNVTHTIYSDSPQIPFSGIVAMTFPDRATDNYPAPAATLGSLLVETPNGNINGDAAGILQIALNGKTYSAAQTVVLAGYELRDNQGNPVDAAHTQGADSVFVSANRDINFKNSGIIASNAKLDASGSIYGFIFSGGNLDIKAQENVNVTALGVGNVSVSSGGSISGTIVGVGSVSVSGSSVDAALISANVSGATSGQSGLGQGTAANGTSQAAASEESAKTTASSTDDNTTGSDLKKKNGKSIALAQKVSRVTVLLPSKN